MAFHETFEFGFNADVFVVIQKGDLPSDELLKPVLGVFSDLETVIMFIGQNINTDKSIDDHLDAIETQMKLMRVPEYKFGYSPRIKRAIIETSPNCYLEVLQYNLSQNINISCSNTEN